MLNKRRRYDRTVKDAARFRRLMAAARKTGQITLTDCRNSYGCWRIFWGADNNARKQHLDGRSAEACVDLLAGADTA